MDDKNLSFQPGVTPVTEPQNSGTVQDVLRPASPVVSSTNTVQPSVSTGNTEPIPSPYESLDGPDENTAVGSTAVVSTPAPDNATNPLRQAPLPQKKKFGFRDTDINKLLMRVITGALVVMLLLFGAGMISSRLSKNRAVDPVTQLEEQEVTSLSGGEATLGVKTSQNTLLVNGNILTTQSLQVTNGSVYGTIAFNGGAQDQTYTLPDASGVFCLDSNNCGYLQAEDVTTIAGVDGAITLGDGLAINGSELSNSIIQTSLNNSVGAITLQGTDSQIGISKNGNVITISAAQDISTSSSPTFNAIVLTGTGAQNGNVICDSSNNCDYAVGTDVFTQGGNSFGASAVLGTNDAYSLQLKTSGITRLTIDSSGGVSINNDLTVASQMAIGSMAEITSNRALMISEDYNITTGVVVGASVSTDLNPSSDGDAIISGFASNVTSSGSNGMRLLNGAYLIASHGNSSEIEGVNGSFNYGSNTGGIVTYLVGSLGQADTKISSVSTNSYGSWGISKTLGSGDITGISSGVFGQGILAGSSNLANEGMNIVAGVTGQVAVDSTGTGTIIQGAALVAQNSYVSGTGSIADAYGLYIQDQTGAANNNYGLAIEGADTQALWISSAADNNDSANGIAFGASRDTKLYRSAANTLKTDDNLVVYLDLEVGSQLTIGSAASITANEVISVAETYTATSGVLYGTNSGITLNAGTDSSADAYGAYSDISVQAANAQNYAGAYYGSTSVVTHNGTADMATAVGAQGIANNTSSGDILGAYGAVGLITNTGTGDITTIASGLYGGVQNTNTGVIASAVGLYTGSTINSGGGTIDANYGIMVAAQTEGVSDYGIAIEAADTQTLWLSPNFDNTTANAGIAFGSSADTNLYRSAANTLKTDGNLIVDLDITASGDLQVVNATVTGTLDVTLAATFSNKLTVNGHIITGNTSGTTTIAVNTGAAGTGATASISGNDTSGVITINTGTGAAAGTLATVTFANAYGTAPRVVITPKAIPGGGTFPQYHFDSGTTTFDLKAFNALTDSSTYTFTYFIAQ